MLITVHTDNCSSFSMFEAKQIKVNLCKVNLQYYYEANCLVQRKVRSLSSAWTLTKFCLLPAQHFIFPFLACFSYLSRNPRPMLLINEHISNLLYAMMEELAAEIHPSLTQISADLRRSDIGKPF